MRKKLESSKPLAFIIGILLVSSVSVSATIPTPVPPAPQDVSDGQKAHLKGVIIGRSGDVVTVRTLENDVRNVLLESGTRVETATWWWANKRSVTYLVPGMRVEVWGTGNSQTQLVARKITFDREDMKMAAAANGAVAPVLAEQALLRERQTQLENRQAALEAQQQKLAGQQDELQNSHAQLKGQVGQIMSDHDQLKADLLSIKGDLLRTKEETAMFGKRLSEQSDYETRQSTKVNFATNKATLTPEGKAALDEIAAKALSTEGYMIEVTGFTDSVGKETHNHELSRRRAEVVVDYLTGAKQVPIRRLLTPVGFGESRPVADNSTDIGRAENRRTEVKVLVNRQMVKNQ